MSVLEVFQITQKFTDIFNIRLCPLYKSGTTHGKMSTALVLWLNRYCIHNATMSYLSSAQTYISTGPRRQWRTYKWGGTDLSWYWKWHIYLTQTVFNGTRSETRNSIACLFWENTFRIKGVREAKASRKGTKHDVISPGITWVWSHRKLKNSPIELLMKYSVFTT